jgi:predicted ABC-type ATPase
LRDIVVIGGPNGAGKTTAAPAVVPQELGIREFVNADEIARGLSPFNAEGAAIAAGRLMIERMQAFVRSGEKRVTLLFLWLPSSRAALDRVARRVRQGGHGIPDNVVVRRYNAGLVNLRDLYLPLADVAAIYDNSDEGRTLIAERMPNASLVVHDPARWAMIERV